MAKEKEMILWVTILDDDGNPIYRIKSDSHRDMYFLFEVNQNKEVKTKYKSKNPIDLYKYVRL